MPSPTSSAEPRPLLLKSLEQFDLAASRRGFIATQVFPVLDVELAASPFGKIKLEQLLQQKTTIRAPGSGYNRGDWKFDMDSYATVENGWEEPIDDREAKMYADYFQAEVIATQRAQDFVLRNMEQRVADLVFNTGTWTGAALATGVGTPWSTSATATPIADVNGAKNKVWDGTGIWPDTMIISQKTYNELRICDEVIDAIASAGAGESAAQGNVSAALIATVFDLPKILIAGAAKNTANAAQTRSLASVWSDSMVMICKTADSLDIREPCIGRTFHWSADGSSIQGLVESYRDEPKRSNIIRVRMDTMEKVIYKEMGHLLTGVS